MANRLAHEKSPYLRQHADNPVDWFPWGPEALERARQEDRPILVSIGYSACHWCHVMAHESFDNPDIARLMNEHFVCIKVDREERPDVDSVYMDAAMALNGHGGWPLNLFLTPDGRPFFGGTYYPPVAGRGLPSWTQVLEAMADAYRTRRADVVHSAETLTAHLEQAQRPRAGGAVPDAALFERAWQAAAREIDWQHGGFGGAPKFPQPLALEFALRAAVRLHSDEALRFVELSLVRMASGGIYDQVGGGFHRYAVDSVWLVPHFEKMLYDNALLAESYLHAYQSTGRALYRSITEGTLDYLLREMRATHGGFYAAQDADSEGVEGKYYVWTPDQFRAVLGDGWEEAAQRYGVTAEGNFEGATILTAPEGRTVSTDTASSRRQREALLRARATRVAPATDTKIVLSWNALAIRALARAGLALGRDDYVAAACSAADFLLSELRPSGRLVRSFLDGPADIDAFLEDYAYLTESLTVLYEVTSRLRYLTAAEELASDMMRRFWDPVQLMFFDAASRQDLPVRPRNLFDNPIPSGTSSATFGLLRLAALTGSTEYRDEVAAVFAGAGELMLRAPLGLSYLLCALDFYASSPLQVAVVGTRQEPATERLLAAVTDRYLPNAVLAVGEPEAMPLLSGRTRVHGASTAYVCRDFTCDLPVTDRSALAALLDRMT